MLNQSDADELNKANYYLEEAYDALIKINELAIMAVSGSVRDVSDWDIFREISKIVDRVAKAD